jgi:hypothetical protein
MPSYGATLATEISGKGQRSFSSREWYRFYRAHATADHVPCSGAVYPSGRSCIVPVYLSQIHDVEGGNACGISSRCWHALSARIGILI